MIKKNQLVDRYFPISLEAKKCLASACPRMGKLITNSPSPHRKITPDPFEALCHSIIGQQLSLKAAATISQRFEQALSNVTPESVIALSPDALRQCGISGRKVDSITELAVKAHSKKIDFDLLHQLSDSEITEQLVNLKGVGPWTAEMLLLFSLERPDILSFSDYGIRKGLCLLHAINEIDSTTFNRFRDLYSPFGSVASLYLWQSLE